MARVIESSTRWGNVQVGDGFVPIGSCRSVRVVDIDDQGRATIVANDGSGQWAVLSLRSSFPVGAIRADHVRWRDPVRSCGLLGRLLGVRS